MRRTRVIFVLIWQCDKQVSLLSVRVFNVLVLFGAAMCEQVEQAQRVVIGVIVLFIFKLIMFGSDV